MTVRHFVLAEDQTLVIYKSNKCSEALFHLSSHHDTLFYVRNLSTQRFLCACLCAFTGTLEPLFAGKFAYLVFINVS